MAIPIINLLEAIQIQANKSRPMASFSGRLKGLTHALLKQDSIGQTGKSVVVGQTKQFRLQVPSLGNIFGNNVSPTPAPEADVIGPYLYINLCSVLFDVNPDLV